MVLKGLNKNMEKITKENIEKEYPNNLRNNVLIKKKDLEDKYFDLLNKYNRFLASFLKEKLPLEQIDENMSKSELDFVKIEEKDMDFYQSIWSIPRHHHPSRMGEKRVLRRGSTWRWECDRIPLQHLLRH